MSKVQLRPLDLELQNERRNSLWTAIEMLVSNPFADAFPPAVGNAPRIQAQILLSPVFPSRHHQP
jgi:hypothetical protein